MPKLRIRELREAKGMTQCDLGQLMGVSHVTVSGWENGTRMPMAARLPDLATVLGVEVNELFGCEPAAS